MKRLVLSAVLATGLFADCELNDWQFGQYSDEFIVINGSASCDKGELVIKAYDEKDRYIGDKIAYIDAGRFKTYMSGTAPLNMQIKYSIYTR